RALRRGLRNRREPGGARAASRPFGLPPGSRRRRPTDSCGLLRHPTNQRRPGIAPRGMREVNGSMAVTDIESRGRRLSAVEPPRRRETRLTSLTRALLTLVIIVTSVVGVALFGVSRGELWLDEAQSVAIARLPVGELL